MKTIIFFILFILVCASILSQNITNTLGTSGLFTIKDGSTNYMSLSQSTGYLSLNRSLNLPNTTSSTTGVIFKGADRFIHNYNSSAAFGYNTFLGINAGNFTMSGSGPDASYNTGIGHSSLTSNTNGYNNTAVGVQSLSFNTTGSGNTAVGGQSLYSNSSGYENTAVGTLSLYANSTGFSNTALGTLSLYANTTGYENTAVGNRSLFSNTTGYNNTAIGYQSFYANTTGSFNTALGVNSLYTNTSGNENTAMGMYSLNFNTTGSSNTSLGYNSLYNNTTGSQNTAVGHHSLLNSTNHYNTALGYNAGSSVTTGHNLTLLGIDANPSSGTAIDQITLGNGFVGSLRCNVTTITSLSDARDKKNITGLTLGLDFISKLKPRQYNWDKREWYESNISDGSKMQESPTAGFIAQEFDEVQTTENAEWLNLVLKDNPDKWEATPGNLLPIMVKAIQELKAENDMLKTEIESLKNNEERIAKLEQMILELNQTKEVKLGEK